MKPRVVIGILLLMAVLMVGITYVRVSLLKSGAPAEPARTPSVADAPIRVYGRVEPLGREVFVGPVQPGRVSRIWVEEGQDVSVGMVLCEIDSDVPRQVLQIAIARVGELQAKLDMVLDELQRKQKLLPDRAVAEIEVSQKHLEAQMLRKQIVTAEAEVEWRRRELETYVLRSPIDGRLYKLDVRLGEYLTPQDAQRIVIGKHRKQVRLFVEAFWADKVAVGDRFHARDAETLRSLGNGSITYVAAYTGSRDFRTEDALERLDTKYGQAILELEGDIDIPLGSLVSCERLDERREN
uniref:HlyD family secretion protein n=1 Tax=Desulfatirhabdium butyrativorans TaxID=340467 RepID=A0A7C4RTN6_9BACT